MCDIRHVKVVILGQDPYHGPNQAHGLCFSVQRPVPSPLSLENIYKELSTDIDGFVHPGHGDLSGWAKQGEPTTARCALDGFQHTFFFCPAGLCF